jgi:methionine-rich copper-binding protein CopC
MKIKILCLSAFVCALGMNLSIAQTKTIAYQELPDALGNTSGSGIFLGATMTNSDITVTFTGPSDRWISLGFGSFMDPTDVLMYSGGKTGATHAVDWFDYYNSASNATGVNKDGTQNWTITSNTVTSGQRTVVATRVLNTADVNDVTLLYSAANLNVVWARGGTASYTITYHGASNRAAGIVLPWTLPDATNPTLAVSSALSPADNATGIALSTNLTSTFSENVQLGTGLIRLYESAGTLVESFDVTSSTNVTVSGATVTINPTANLSFSTSYYCTIDNGAIVDLASNPYAGFSDNSTWNFTTEVNSASTLELGETNYVQIKDKHIFIHLDGSSDFSVQIFDAQGKLVSDTKNQKMIDLSKENNGVYLMTILLGQENVQTRFLLD